MRGLRLPSVGRLPLIVYAAGQAVLLFWWCAFYPGLMSFDSMAYVWHVTTGNWMANHSVPYDGLVWLSLQTTGDLALLTLLQTVAASAVLAYAAGVLKELGVAPVWAALGAVTPTVLPPTATFLIHVWKDVPFAISAILIFAVTGRLAFRREPTWRLLTLLGIGCAGLVLSRNNGFLTLIIAAPLLIVGLRGMRLRIAAVTLTPIVVSFLLTGLLYPALNIVSAAPHLTYATAYSDIAVVYKEKPASFTAEDKALMFSIAPELRWREANCYTSDSLTYKADFSRPAADAASGKLLELWIRTIKRTPTSVLDARLCRGTIAWSVWSRDWNGGGGTSTSPTTIKERRFGWNSGPNGKLRGSRYLPVLRIRPLIAPAHSLAESAERASKKRQLDWILWRGATWCYIAYAAVLFFACRRRTPAALAMLAIVVGLQLAVLVSTPAQLFRYMAAPIMIGLLAAPLVTVRRRPVRHSAEEGPGVVPAFETRVQ